jgi:hypothetical protein
MPDAVESMMYAGQVPLGPQIERRSPPDAKRLSALGRHVEDAADGGGPPDALTPRNIGTTERGTAEQPAAHGVRASRVPLPSERYYPFPFRGTELPGTGTGAFILPSRSRLSAAISCRIGPG